MERSVALLRGINIGARNRIAMPALAEGFASLGFQSVQTYLQSGNVVFSHEAQDGEHLRAVITQMIQERFACTVPVIVVAAARWRAIQTRNPFLQQASIDQTKLHVTFFASTPDPENLAKLPSDPGRGDSWAPGGEVIYLYCPVNYGETKLSNALFERTLKLTATTRNWNTVTALTELL